MKALWMVCSFVGALVAGNIVYAVVSSGLSAYVNMAEPAADLVGAIVALGLIVWFLRFVWASLKRADRQSAPTP
jgi:hypothetical protein